MVRGNRLGRIAIFGLMVSSAALASDKCQNRCLEKGQSCMSRCTDPKCFQRCTDEGQSCAEACGITEPKHKCYDTKGRLRSCDDAPEAPGKLPSP